MHLAPSEVLLTLHSCTLSCKFIYASAWTHPCLLTHVGLYQTHSRKHSQLQRCNFSNNNGETKSTWALEAKSWSQVGKRGKTGFNQTLIYVHSFPPLPTIFLFTGGWVGPKAGLYWQKISPHQDSIPGPSSPQSVAIPTELPGPHWFLLYQGIMYRVIWNDCWGFNNLSYTIHLRQEYMYFFI